MSIGFAIFSHDGHFLILDRAEIYHSGAMQSDHAACKICNYGCSGFRKCII